MSNFFEIHVFFREFNVATQTWMEAYEGEDALKRKTSSTTRTVLRTFADDGGRRRVALHSHYGTDYEDDSHNALGKLRKFKFQARYCSHLKLHQFYPYYFQIVTFYIR